MLSESAARQVAELRQLGDDGVLSAAGTIEVAPGVFEDAEVIVAQLLRAIDRAEQSPTADVEQHRALEAEIERLYRRIKARV
jgi:hypothetical protein